MITQKGKPAGWTWAPSSAECEGSRQPMITRRTVLTRVSLDAAGALALPAILHWSANAVEFAYKYGTALPEGHPMVIRSKEAAAKIKEESGGRLDITLYPSSVLGQDTAMMSQAIAGALEIYGMSMDILAQKNLPVAPLFISLFRHLGASPTPINFGEVYSALQTGLVDGQENPLILIDTAKLYEVQKYCSMTNHIWVGLHVAFNNAAWKRLPADLQELTHKHFSDAAIAERADWQVMDKSEIEKMTKAGLVFNRPELKPFQDALRKSGFYPEIKQQMGNEAWTLLEKDVGPLTW